MKQVRKSFTITSTSGGGSFQVGDVISMDVTEYNRWEKFRQRVRFLFWSRIGYPIKHLFQ